MRDEVRLFLMFKSLFSVGSFVKVKKRIIGINKVKLKLRDWIAGSKTNKNFSA